MRPSELRGERPRGFGGRVGARSGAADTVNSSALLSAGNPCVSHTSTPCPTPRHEPLPSRRPDPLATSRMGVTLAGLRRIRAALLAHFGAPRFAHLSTAEVNSLWVQPLTRARRCRLLELPPPEGPVLPGDVAQPMYFISHAVRHRSRRVAT